jgi:shikimate dehydrogenase
MTDKDALPVLNIDRYAVVGNPIAHSKSPLIHAAFAKQTNQEMSYERILAPLDGFDAMIKELIAQRYKGVNVTVPFKFEAFNLCDTLTDRAQAAGAVNTLTFKDNQINGDNTDGTGLVRDITHNLKHILHNKRTLLLGAGGAAEGVLQPLLACELGSLVIANRTIEKAERMISRQVGALHQLSASTYADLNNPFDIIINATSAGLTDTTLPIANIIFAENGLAYDMMYGRETPFMAQARANGAQVADGLGMLVEQAAEAFYIWRGVRPDTKPIIEMIRAL